MVLLSLLACKGEPLDAGWCSDDVATPQPTTTPVTWWHDVQPILAEKCAACHVEGGHAPFAVATYDDVEPWADAIASSSLARTMPPFFAADCCRDYYRSYGLTDEEIATLAGWAEQGAPEGDAADAGAARDPLGGVSRVDLTVEMPDPYTPSPPDGAVDEQRCFVLDWPETETRYITGMAPRPGNRAVVHHLIVSTVDERGAETARALDAEDDEPGFDCSGGTGDLGIVVPLGGSLVGGDYPRGIGTKIEPGATIVLQVHYSVASGTTAEPDQTAVDFKLDDSAVDAGGIAIANLAWLVGPGMTIPAGEADVPYFYKFKPTIFTGGTAVDLQGVTPHMHRYGSRIRVLALHPDGTDDCLLEIPDWEFGWEQPYWFEEPLRFDPDDELYVECHFDNSAANQYGGAEPRDIAWGDSDQDMCAAFLNFTKP
jgi:hypothetical protein